MKKRILILIAAIVIIGAVIALLVPKTPKSKLPGEASRENDPQTETKAPSGEKKPSGTEEPGTTEEKKSDASEEEKSSGTEKPGETEKKEPEPLPESGTAYIDKENDVSVTIGVAEGDSVLEEDEDEPEPTQTGEQPTSAEEPTDPQEPEQGGETPSDPPVTPERTTLKYEEFYALSPEEKDAYLNSFGDYNAFFNWYVAAQEQFTKEHPDIEIGPGGTIDLSKLKPWQES